jgi:hypothetical protein
LLTRAWRLRRTMVLTLICIALGIIALRRAEYFGGVILILVAAFGTSLHLLPAEFRRKEFFISWFAAGMIIASFVLGYQNARERLAAGTWATHIITMSRQTDDLRVRLIRSGDRGLLFFDPATKTINFVKWSDVKSIQSLCNC